MLKGALIFTTGTTIYLGVKLSYIHHILDTAYLPAEQDLIMGCIQRKETVVNTDSYESNWSVDRSYDSYDEVLPRVCKRVETLFPQYHIEYNYEVVGGNMCFDDLKVTFTIKNKD